VSEVQVGPARCTSYHLASPRAEHAGHYAHRAGEARLGALLRLGGANRPTQKSRALYRRAARSARAASRREAGDMPAAGDDPAIVDAWSTTKREFQNGNELLEPECAEDLAELYASFQLPDGNGDAAGLLGVDMDTVVEWLRIWPEDSSFCLEDLTLRTHVNAVTGDKLFYWNYGLGGNDYGTYHFLLAGKPRSSAVHVISNSDGDISFLGQSYDKFVSIEAWPKPESEDAHEAWARQVKGLIDFYQRVEKKDDYDQDAYKKVFRHNSTPVDVARFPVDDGEDSD